MKKVLGAWLCLVAGPVLADTGNLGPGLDTECEPEVTWPDPLPAGLSFISAGFRWQGANPPTNLNNGAPARNNSCYVEIRREPRSNSATGVGAPVRLSTYYKINFLYSRIHDVMARGAEMAIWSMDFSDQMGTSAWLNVYVEPLSRTIRAEKATVDSEGKRVVVRKVFDYAMSGPETPCAFIEVTRTPQALTISSAGPGETWTVSVTCPITGASASVAYTFDDRRSGNLYVGRLNQFYPVGDFTFQLY